MIYYFINYEKQITAIGESNPSYMKDRGYTLVDKETHEQYENEHRVEIDFEEDEN